MEPTINSVRVPRYIPFVCHDGDVIPVVLANVACACIFLSLEVSTCQASTAVYRPIQRRKLGALGGDHYKRAMNLASKRLPEMKCMSVITVVKGILYSIPPYITVGAVNVMNRYALYR